MSGEGRRRDRGAFRNLGKQKLIRNSEEELESKLGFDLFTEGEKRLGWLLTLASVSRQIALCFFAVISLCLFYSFFF